MLSPAPLRVCCLAVMAPALTKADRRADCLPVVLPFCVQKTALRDNREEFNVESDLPRFPSKIASLLKRKPLLHRAWFRSCMRNGSDHLSDRTRFTVPDPRKSPGRNRVSAEGRPWPSATLALADKVRLKYTMSKSSSSIRNMGLAKANTSLGLQGMRKMNRFAVSHKDKSINPSTRESGESSPELPDSTNSELDTPFQIVRIVQTPRTEEITSTMCDVSTDETTRVPEVPDSTKISLLSLNNKLTPLSLPECSIDIEGRSSELPLNANSLGSLLCSTACDTPSAGSASSTPENCTLSPGTREALNVTEDHRPAEFTSVVLPPCHVLDTGEVSLPSPPSALLAHESDGESINDTFSSSSTLSADASPLPSSLDEANDTVFVTFPDLLTASASCSVADLPSHTFSDVPYLTPKSPLTAKSFKCVDRTLKTCCPLTDGDYVNIQGMVQELEDKLSKNLLETENIMRKLLIDHTNVQLRTLVMHLQKESGVPCQRPMRSSSSKPPKDVDYKTEVLQREGVKSMSTAALVSLVRKLESGTPADGLFTQQKPVEGGNTQEGPSFTSDDCLDVNRTSRTLLKSMKTLLRTTDPDLTESSDEEASDMETEELAQNVIQKRALWKFSKERSALTSRSTWLIARIHELENHLRSLSGPLKKLSSDRELCFEDPPEITSTDSTKPNRLKGMGRTLNGYLDHNSVHSVVDVTGGAPLGNSDVPCDSNSSVSCSRTRALQQSSFHKRKLLVTTGLHLTNSKVAKLSTVGCLCNCMEDSMPCVLCTGRYNCVQSVDPDSLPLFDRIGLLDPYFHPLLSFGKDIPMLFHFENILKKNESQYQVVRPCSPPIQSTSRESSYWTKQKRFSDSRRSRKLSKYARSLLTSKYRNKKHFRKHKLVFGKWRRLQNKSSFKARNRIRRYSAVSSGSSHDSPVPSPLSLFDDGSGYESKRRRDDNQFDIDDVIIPYSSKRGRLVKFEFKDIEIPSWRYKEYENLESTDIEEDTSDAAYIKRHESYEIEERRILRTGGGALPFFNTWQKRARRHHRSDSRADSSGANTPDPVLNPLEQDMFQDGNSNHAGGPLLSPPALSPPATPLSAANVISDDSQQPPGQNRRRASGGKRIEDSSSNSRQMGMPDFDEIPPYEPRVFPLSDEVIAQMLAESEHNRDDDATISGPSCPASPGSSTESTSTLEEDDITDPEWTVVRRESGHEQPLVLKFAKR